MYFCTQNIFYSFMLFSYSVIETVASPITAPSQSQELTASVALKRRSEGPGFTNVELPSPGPVLDGSSSDSSLSRGSLASLPAQGAATQCSPAQGSMTQGSPAQGSTQGTPNRAVPARESSVEIESRINLTQRNQSGDDGDRCVIFIPLQRQAQFGAG